MLDRSVSYRTLFRCAGMVLILYGLYLVVCALTAQITVSGSMEYAGSLLLFDPGAVVLYIFWGGFLFGNSLLPMPLLVAIPPYILPGPLLYIGVGLLCVGFMSRRVWVMYLCLQVALWFISFSFWVPITQQVNHGAFSVSESFTLLFFVTLASSCALLIAYKPVLFLLQKLFRLDTSRPVTHA